MCDELIRRIRDYFLLLNNNATSRPRSRTPEDTPRSMYSVVLSSCPDPPKPEKLLGVKLDFLSPAEAPSDALLSDESDLEGLLPLNCDESGLPDEFPLDCEASDSLDILPSDCDESELVEVSVSDFAESDPLGLLPPN